MIPWRCPRGSGTKRRSAAAAGRHGPDGLELEAQLPDQRVIGGVLLEHLEAPLVVAEALAGPIVLGVEEPGIAAELGPQLADLGHLVGRIDRRGVGPEAGDLL